MAVRKIENGEVYAGTVVESELTIRVKRQMDRSKFEDRDDDRRIRNSNPDWKAK